MAQNEVIITFPVSKAAASRMEVLRKWLDPNDEAIWDINHYAKKKFQEGFQKDDKAKKAHDEQVKAESEALNRQKEAEKKATLDAESLNASNEYE